MLLRVFDAATDREIVNGNMVSFTFVGQEAHWYLAKVNYPAKPLLGCPDDDMTRIEASQEAEPQGGFGGEGSDAPFPP